MAIFQLIINFSLIFLILNIKYTTHALNDNYEVISLRDLVSSIKIDGSYTNIGRLMNTDKTKCFGFSFSTIMLSRHMNVHAMIIQTNKGIGIIQIHPSGNSEAIDIWINENEEYETKQIDRNFKSFIMSASSREIPLCGISILVCKSGHYGRNCSEMCHCLENTCDLDEQNSCSSDQCKPGYLGSSCHQECTEGKYGDGCVHHCRCKNNKVCDFKSGRCEGGCIPGYMAASCNIKKLTPKEVHAPVLISGNLTSNSALLSVLPWRDNLAKNFQVTYNIMYREVGVDKFYHSGVNSAKQNNFKQPIDALRLNNLNYSTTYEVFMNVKIKMVYDDNKAHVVNGTQTMKFTTKCKDPNKPTLTTSDREAGKIIIQWKMMSQKDMFCTGPFHYHLSHNDSNIFVHLSSDKVEYEFNANASMNYTIRLRSVNNQYLYSSWTITELPAELKSVSYAKLTSMPHSTIAIILCIFFSLVVAISGIAFTIYRRNYSKYESVRVKEASDVNAIKVVKGGHIGGGGGDQIANQNAFKVDEPPLQLSVYPNSEPKVCFGETHLNIPPIPLEELETYILNRQNSDAYQKEYEDIPEGLTSDTIVGKKDENKPKNRFMNIIAYDHSRVILQVDDTKHEGDYINANYINNYLGRPEYIAAQGCTKYTCEDMWRMVWQENCHRIVMTTNLVERGKRKCECYWPEKLEETKTYANIEVLFKEMEKTSDFIIRTFEITKSVSGKDETRQIKQLHFTCWPDHGVPTRAAPIIKLRNRVREMATSYPGVVIVHCSAGVGRTGTFIAIDTLLEQAKAENKVDIYNFTISMRRDRVNMIQTMDQYIFVHDALLEMTISLNTLIPCSQFSDVLIRMLHLDQDDSDDNKPECDRMLMEKPICNLEKQYQRLMRMSPKLTECRVSMLKQNASKNRKDNIFAGDKHRPYLGIRVQGTNDYINAVFLHGPWKHNAYIITQMPLPHTVIDFWRMVFEQYTTTIVMLNAHSPDDAKYGQYWPEDEACECGPFIIEPISVDTSDEQITIHVLRITYKTIDPSTKQEKDISRVINQFQLNVWPDFTDVPSCSKALISLTEHVEKSISQANYGPVVIHCLDGQTKSGVFASICSIWEKMKIDHDVDIFHTVKQFRNSRTGIIKNYEQYKFCHDMVLAYLDEYNTYANFR